MRTINFSITILAAAVLLASCGKSGANRKPAIYLDDSKPVETRVEDALKRMTLEEKIDMLHAQSAFSSRGVPRLGIPDVWFADGSHGIREEAVWDGRRSAGRTNDSCAVFPALTCLAATWDPEMAELYGKAIGEEARYRNKHILLGPRVNISRTPFGGRNFEYMGEDPYLASRMVAPYVRGVQSQGVAACVGNFALDNQQADSMGVNISVGDRALYEIYLPAFRAAVTEGGAWAVMGAGNSYRDQNCSHNQYLLNDILKGEWEFDGVVVSDWGAVGDTRQAAANGLDIERGTAVPDYRNFHMGEPLLELVKSGEVDVKLIDDKVRRILRLIFRTSMDRNRPFGSFATPEHFEASRRIAESGIVLLKNDNALLPLEPSATGTILVVGENASKYMTADGKIPALKTKYEVLPIEGLRAKYGADKVRYMAGYASSADSTRVAEPLGDILAAAQAADAVLFIGGLGRNPHEDCEGTDRISMSLPYGQDELIEAIAAANPRTAVVIISGNPVAMSWKERVGAVVQSWYLGSEAGNALASVISGDVNPSGKLPFTYYSSTADCGAHVLGDYPGAHGRQTYMDDIWVGYRYTDKKGEGANPNFPFGHGLSYTTFEYSAISGDKDVIADDGTVKITVTVKNTGKRRGSEVVQLYIGDNYCTVARPVKELKGFRKVMLDAGKSTKVTFTVGRDALSFFDDRSHQWVVEKGNFTAFVGSSATDIRGIVEFSVL